MYRWEDRSNNIVTHLGDNGANILRTSAKDIERNEDRNMFLDMLDTNLHGLS